MLSMRAIASSAYNVYSAIHDDPPTSRYCFDADKHNNKINKSNIFIGNENLNKKYLTPYNYISC